MAAGAVDAAGSLVLRLCPPTYAQGRIATPDVRMPMANASTAAVDRCLAAIDRASG